MSRVAGAANPNIHHDFTPHAHWIRTGQTWDDGKGGEPRPIYAEKRPSHTHEIVRDEKGDEVWHRNPQTGLRIRPVTRLIERWEVKEFVLAPLGNGNTVKNFHFRPDPADKARAERKQTKDQLLERLADALERRNLSIDDLVAAVEVDDVASSFDPDPPVEDGKVILGSGASNTTTRRKK